MATRIKLNVKETENWVTQNEYFLRTQEKLTLLENASGGKLYRAAISYVRM